MLPDVKTHQRDAGLFTSAAPAREERKEIHESAQSTAQKCISLETGAGDLSKESFPHRKGTLSTQQLSPWQREPCRRSRRMAGQKTD